MNLTNLERLRELVKTSKPDRLEAFDAYLHRKQVALHPDDDLWMILEIIGFQSELAAEIPERLGTVVDRVVAQAAQVEEASALVQNETAKILSLVKDLADELPERFDSQAVARRIGERIQAEEIGPLLTARTAVIAATANLNIAAERAQRAHGVIERAASIVPWITSAVICAVLAIAASAIIIQSDREVVRESVVRQLENLPAVYRDLASQGRTLELLNAGDGSRQLVLSGKAEGAFVVPDGRAVLQFR
jgi:hypothetical protein